MEDKGTAKKAWAKIGFGVLFVISCFIAMYILMGYHDNIALVGIAAFLLLISAFLFMNAAFSDKAKNLIPELEEDDTPSAGDGEFKLKITKHMKEMESTQKELIDVLKNQNTLLQTQIENLEHEIYMLSEKQVHHAKLAIKYNKENARQLAISERESLEHVMHELKKAIEENSTPVAAGYAAPEAEPVMAAEYMVSAEEAEPVLEEIADEELFAVSDLPGDDEFVMPDFPEAEPEKTVTPAEEAPIEEEEAADVDVSELFEMMEDLPVEEDIVIPDMPEDIEIPMPEDIIAIEEPAAEPEPVAEPEPAAEAPAANPLAGLGADPNAMMTPEDIAKLLESMGK